MQKGKRPQKESFILWGEGPTDHLFLELFKQYYRKELSEKSIKIGHGTGGSPGDILEALDKKVLSQGDPKASALVLLDKDNGLDEATEKVLKKYTNTVNGTNEAVCSITVVFSKPQCLEGLLLDLLHDLPGGQKNSETLKKYFQKEHLGSCDHVQRNFKKKRSELFPKELLDKKMNSHPVLKELSQFLKLNIQ